MTVEIRENPTLSRPILIPSLDSNMSTVRVVYICMSKSQLDKTKVVPTIASMASPETTITMEGG
jgi:hypothetical protein